MRLNSSAMTRRPRISGFTLVELLVVMVVIVFLMGLIFGGIKSAMHIAACAHAKQDVKSLVGAIEAYRAEYGTFPASIIDATVNTSTNFGLTATLRGANAKNITFWKVNPDRLETGVESYLDPWGNSYRVRALAAGQDVRVWSFGPDGNNDSGNATDSAGDDIRSWTSD